MAKDLLPDAARVLPPAGQGVWLRAFKEAQTKGLPEDEASAFAWAAVKRAGYHKLAGGKWGKSMETNFSLDGDNLTIGVPFVKVNTKNRTVSGFATLNNVDQAGEIVDSSASQKAFKKWVGNIREMHQKRAVGKAIEMTEKQYTDDTNGETYDGIWITAKISKGAEDTWQKVLDGTLCGFSIGGAVFEKEKTVVKSEDGDREAWIIKDYALNEVSLVDNPCNQLAAVALVKSVDGVLEYEDVIEDGEIEKGYVPHSDFADYTPQLRTVVTALESYRDAAIAANDDRSTSMAADALSRFRCMAECEAEDAAMQDKIKAMNAAADAVTKDNDSKENKEVPVEKELQNKEVSDTSSTDELSKEDKSMLRRLFEKFLGDEEITKSEVEASDEIEKEGSVTSDMEKEEVEGLVGTAIEGVTKDLDDKFASIGDSLTKVAEALDTVAKAESVEELKKDFEEKIEALTERIKEVEEGGAVKKSADAAETGEKLEKSEGLWADAIVPEFIRKNA